MPHLFHQVELLQQQVVNLEAQLAQQSVLKLQEFITSLNSGDPHKQALGLQLTKFLEQVQNNAEQSPMQIHSNSSMTQLHDPNTIQHFQLPLKETNTTINHDLSSSTVVDHLTVDGSGSVVNQLAGIPDGYEVISTTPEGHVIVSKARTTSMTSDEDNISVTADETSHLLDTSHSHNASDVTTTESSSSIIPPKSSSHDGLIDSVELSEVVHGPSNHSLVESDVRHCVEHAVLNDIASSNGNELLHVVSTDGNPVSININEQQISLNANDKHLLSEVTVANPESNNHNKEHIQEYVVDIVDANGIFMKAPIHNQTSTVVTQELPQTSQCGTPDMDGSGEPKTKSLRLTL